MLLPVVIQLRVESGDEGKWASVAIYGGKFKVVNN
jgi:hypothetical protein